MLLAFPAPQPAPSGRQAGSECAQESSVHATSAPPWRGRWLLRVANAVDGLVESSIDHGRSVADIVLYKIYNIPMATDSVPLQDFEDLVHWIQLSLYGLGVEPRFAAMLSASALVLVVCVLLVWWGGQRVWGVP